MRTGKELILSTKQFAVEDRPRSWWAVGSTLLLLVAAVAATVLAPLALKWIPSLLSGLLVVRFFVIYHDHQHHAILDRSRVADAIMRTFGLFIMSPTTVWKQSHNFHHIHNSKLHTAHIGSFPIMTRERYLEATLGERIVYGFMRHPGTILFGYFFVFAMGMCVVPLLSDPRRHLDSLLALVLHVTIGALIFILGGWSNLIFAFLLPLFIASGLGSYLFYAQHNFPEVVHQHDDDGWTYEAAAMESSSFLRMPAWMHWFTANIGYHHIHHLNSRIPFYRLPEVMEEMPELQSPRTTSLAPAEVIRCLRLHVWDPDLGRMITRSEARRAA